MWQKTPSVLKTPPALRRKNYQNLKSKIDFKEISTSYNKNTVPIIRVFEINIQKKNTLNSNPYFIFPKLENLEFQENYQQIEESGYYYIELQSLDETIVTVTAKVEEETLNRLDYLIERQLSSFNDFILNCAV